MIKMQIRLFYLVGTVALGECKPWALMSIFYAELRLKLKVDSLVFNLFLNTFVECCVYFAHQRIIMKMNKV